MKKKFYPILTEAQQATQALAIPTRSQYQQRYREDPRLPSHPNEVYADEWQNWPTFLNTSNKFYSTLTEAQQATQALAISTMSQYQQRYREDSRLPSLPNDVYANEWQNWPTFLNTSNKFYSTLTEAQQATQALAISSSSQYQQRYREDPRLPSNPSEVYADEWQNWPTFLNTSNKFYSTLTEAQQATQALAISTRIQYKQRYREDPRLPSNPDEVYADEWQNWPTFLGNEIKNFYSTLTEAQQATQALA
ncbi:integrase, partial [Shewanella frigidimarina]|uniref:integrase repeat-containing protein n=1 Tax=Shewanella frigidimarina TaxID=56812 RepID=UPI000F9B0E51